MKEKLMSLPGRLRGVVVERIRLALSGHLGLAWLLNSLLGRIGAKRYVELARRSEELDPVVDLSAVIGLRRALAADGTNPRYPNRIESVNRIYGIKLALFGEASERLGGPAIEHGPFFSNIIYPADTVYTAAPTCVTFGKFRQDAVQSHQDIAVFTVGPYLQYAEPHYSESRLRRLKEEWGNTLLVYPAHTAPDSSIDATAAARFGWIDELASSFDTVAVSIFWWDVLKEDVEYLRRRGYRLVSFGLTHDRRFLSRQKSLLSLADEVAGDGIGTHIGYAIGEGVPFTFVRSEAALALDDAQRRWASDLDRRREGLLLEERLKEELVRNARASSSSYDLVNHIWGLDQTKSREELSAIAEISMAVARRSWGFRGRYLSAAEGLLAEYESSDPVKYALLADAMPRR